MGRDPYVGDCGSQEPSHVGRENHFCKKNYYGYNQWIVCSKYIYRLTRSCFSQRQLAIFLHNKALLVISEIPASCCQRIEKVWTCRVGLLASYFKRIYCTVCEGSRALSVLLSCCHVRRHEPIYVESWFSDLTAIKTKDINSLNVKGWIETLSQIKPRMD